MNIQKTFRLSVKEAEYISTLESEDSSFQNLLSSLSGICIGRESLTLDHDGAELLRDYFTDRLARFGFDENYQPNEDGVMLERLTDMLFLPDEQWAAG